MQGFVALLVHGTYLLTLANTIGNFIGIHIIFLMEIYP